MKLAHISDLHLGIELKDYSLQEDQAFILKQIVEIMDEQKVDGVMISGDVFDKSVASINAIKLWEDFLKLLVQKNYKVFIISGNHDAAERLSFGHDFMENSGLYFSKAYDGSVKCIKMEDEYGILNVYLLPFVRPANVRAFYPEENIRDFNDSVKLVVEKMNLDVSERNVVLCHQNIVGAERCESENCIFGGLDAVSSDIFEPFDYTALGHIHGAQTFGKKKSIRFCGTPLKYSLSERNHKKSVTIVEFKEKGNVTVSTVPLVPLRNVRLIECDFKTLMAEAGKIPEKSENASETPSRDDFVHVILTDEDEVLNGFYIIRSVYPHLIGLDYNNTRSRNSHQLSELEDAKTLALEPMALLDKFYENRNGIPMNDEQKNYLKELVEQIWGEN